MVLLCSLAKTTIFGPLCLNNVVESKPCLTSSPRPSISTILYHLFVSLMAQVINDNGIKQPTSSTGNGAGGMESPSEQTEKVWGIPIRTLETKGLGPQESKMNPDLSTREIDWTHWDGPVWCSRYGRFENQEDASADDGYTVKGQPPHQGTSLNQTNIPPSPLTTSLDLELVRSEKHDCRNCKVPAPHQSYVQDVQRRVEPMVASLVRLEHQIGTLVHHVTQKKGGASEHAADGGNGNSYVEGGYAQRYDDTTHMHHDPVATSHPQHTQHSGEPLEESVKRLEASVEGLMHQLHQIMNHLGRDIKEEDQDFYQGGR